MTRIIYNGANPIHVAFGDSIGAEPYSMKDRVVKGQPMPLKALRLLRNVMAMPMDSYMLTENCYYYPALVKRLQPWSGARIINMNVGPLLYHLWKGRISGIERKVLLSLLDEVDGHIALGSFGEKVVGELSGKPCVRAYPYITDDMHKRLDEVRPSLDSKNLLIMATHDHVYKGLDIAIEAVKEAYEEDNDIRLHICGNIHDDIVRGMADNHPAILNLGFVDDITEVMSRCRMYIHPSRGDCFPVSSLQAMRAGLPAIVSEDTGTREICEAVGSYVCELDSGHLCSMILQGMDRDLTDASSSFREYAMGFTKERETERFVQAYRRLVDEIE